MRIRRVPASHFFPLSNTLTRLNMEPEFVLKLLTGSLKEKRKNTINDPLDCFQGSVFS